MRLVIVNACHPDSSHVCALRARSFADALARKGHRLLILTPPLDETGKGSDPAGLADRIAGHDWPKPLHVASPYSPGSPLPRLRAGRYPAGLRQARIALQFLRHGSIHEDWVDGTRPLLAVIAEAFRPDAVWAIFGNATPCGPSSAMPDAGGWDRPSHGCPAARGSAT
jgi:hypothetical protein